MSFPLGGYNLASCIHLALTVDNSGIQATLRRAEAVAVTLVPNNSAKDVPNSSASHTARLCETVDRNS